jgi:hypothetical protein
LDFAPELISGKLPFAGPTARTRFFISGKARPLPGREPQTQVFVTDEDYFRTLKIPLKRGRLFSRRETIQSRKVVVINEALAKKYFPNENPIGQSVTLLMKEKNEPAEIIGVLGNVKHDSVQDAAEPRRMGR